MSHRASGMAQWHKPAGIECHPKISESQMGWTSQPSGDDLRNMSRLQLQWKVENYREGHLCVAAPLATAVTWATWPRLVLHGFHLVIESRTATCLSVDCGPAFLSCREFWLANSTLAYPFSALFVLCRLCSCTICGSTGSSRRLIMDMSALLGMRITCLG